MAPTSTRRSNRTSSQRQHKRSKHEGPSVAGAATTFSTPIIIDDEPSPKPYIPDAPLSAENGGKPFVNLIVIDDDTFPDPPVPEVSLSTAKGDKPFSKSSGDPAPEPSVSGMLVSTPIDVKPPVSDLKVFLNFNCMAKTSLFTSLAATKAFEYQLDWRSQHGGFCDYVRVPLFKDEADRFYDNYAVVEKRQGLTQFLEMICPRYQVHLITKQTELLGTAIMKAAMSPLLTTQKHSFSNLGKLMIDRSGIESQSHLVTNLPKTLSSIASSTKWSRIVLVDSTLMNHVSRPANGILISAFTGYKSLNDAQNDESLHGVASLLQDLEPNTIDVQKVLTERFNLPTRLQEQHQIYCKNRSNPLL
jgi:NLI interacting factor-like phosphatase